MSYKITTEDGGRIPAEEGGQRSNYETWGTVEEQTLRVEDSGKSITLLAGNGSIVNLPAAKVGFKVRFYVMRAFSTTDWVITAPAAVIQGVVSVNAANVAASNETTMTLAAGNATVGDWFELEAVQAVGGAVNYVVKGNFTTASAVAFA